MYFTEIKIMKYYLNCFLSVTFFLLDIAHHKRKEIKYITSIALRKLKPMNNPKSPPVLAEKKLCSLVFFNLSLIQN